MIQLREYLGTDERNYFGRWFDRLNAEAARRVTTALEYRIDFGPGYRIYFGKDGEEIVILLCGGTKQRQQDDIKLAQECWQDYKKRNRSEPWR